jgi:hypothetical protein
MRFTIPLLAIMAAAVLANPTTAPNSDIYARDTAEVDLIADSIVFGVESAKCKILKCARVVATGASILTSLPDVTKTLACVKGNSEQVSFQSTIDGYERKAS